MLQNCYTDEILLLVNVIRMYIKSLDVPSPLCLYVQQNMGYKEVTTQLSSVVFIQADNMFRPLC